MELCMLFTLVKTNPDLGAIYCQQLHSLQKIIAIFRKLRRGQVIFVRI